MDPKITHLMNRAVPGDKRCADCGSTAGTKAHRAAREQAAQVQATPVPAPTTAPAVQMVPAPVDYTRKGPLCVQLNTGFEAHSRRPAECRVCGKPQEGHPERIMVPAGSDPVQASAREQAPPDPGAYSAMVHFTVEAQDGGEAAVISDSFEASGYETATYAYASKVDMTHTVEVWRWHEVDENGARDLVRQYGGTGQTVTLYGPGRGAYVADYPAGPTRDAQGPDQGDDSTDGQVCPVCARPKNHIDHTECMYAPEGAHQGGKIMRADVDRVELVAALKYACKGIPARPAVPVLAGVVLTVAGDTLTAHTFDYETFRAADASARGAISGRVALAGIPLLKTINSLPKTVTSVSLVATAVEVTVSDGTETITFPTFPVQDMPAVPAGEHEIGTIDAGTLGALVGRVVVAAGIDETVPVLTSVRVRTDRDEIDFAATDRYRMHLSSGTWAPAIDDGGYLVAPGSEYSVPAKTLSEVTRMFVSRATVGAGRRKTVRPASVTVLAGMISMSPQGSPVSVYGLACDGYRMLTRVIDDPYPPVEGLFPADPNGTATVSPGDLLTVIERVCGTATRAHHGNLIMKFDVADSTMVVDYWDLHTENDGKPTRTVTLSPVSFAGDVPDEFAVNPFYLVDAVKAFGADATSVTFGMLDSLRPVGITSGSVPGLRTMVMPVRVSGRPAPATRAAEPVAAAPVVDTVVEVTPDAGTSDSGPVEAPAVEMPAREHPFTLPSHLVATVDALYTAGEAADGFQVKTLWVPAGGSQTRDGKWIEHDTVSVQIGTRDGYHGDGKSHVVVSWDSWTDRVKVQPGGTLHTLDQVRQYLAGYLDAMQTCRFSSDGLERIYRAVTDGHNPYAKPLPRKVFSGAPVPADFSPYAAEIEGCVCPLCVALVDAVAGGQGPGDAARALFDALYGDHAGPSHVRTVAVDQGDAPDAPTPDVPAADSPAVQGDAGTADSVAGDPSADVRVNTSEFAGMVREIIAGASWTSGVGHFGGSKRRPGKKFVGPIMHPALPDRKLSRDEWTALADQVHELGGGRWMSDVKGFACESADVGNPWRSATVSTHEKVTAWLASHQGDAAVTSGEVADTVTPDAETSGTVDVKAPEVQASTDALPARPVAEVEAPVMVEAAPAPVTVTLVYTDDTPDVAPSVSAVVEEQVSAGFVTTHGAHAQLVNVTGSGVLAGYRFHLVEGVGCRQFAKPSRRALAAAGITGFSVTTPSGSGAVNIAAHGAVTDWSPVLAVVAGVLGDHIAGDSAVCTSCDRAHALAEN